MGWRVSEGGTFLDFFLRFLKMENVSGVEEGVNGVEGEWSGRFLDFFFLDLIFFYRFCFEDFGKLKMLVWWRVSGGGFFEFFFKIFFLRFCFKDLGKC